MNKIDFRSDTVTHPTPAMITAMANAPLGDDVYGDDPTVNLLEERTAQLFNKEAAIFVPTGTMGNLASILAHCDRGDEVIMGTKGHTFLYEAGGIAALGGIHTHTIPNQTDGTLALQDIKVAIRADDIHAPISKLIIIENTQNACGGVVLDATYMNAVADLAHQHDLLVHVDGARIFNASVALGVPAASLTDQADSLTFCLSKGLCCPAGAMIAGNQAFIHKVRRARKMLGGGMRQVGILAAAGLVALDTMIDRLAEDHVHIQQFAEAFRQIPAIELVNDPPATNMLYFTLRKDSPLDADALTEACDKENIILSHRGGSFRLVAHYWIDDAAVDKTIQVIQKLLT
jgi:threonine aldolase